MSDSINLTPVETDDNKDTTSANLSKKRKVDYYLIV